MATGRGPVQVEISAEITAVISTEICRNICYFAEIKITAKKFLFLQSHKNFFTEINISTKHTEPDNKTCFIK